MENQYYTYAYLREDGTPYYIGKGKGKRAYQPYSRNAKCPPKERILFLKINLTEEEAFRHEVYMIAVLGRKDIGTGILRNMSNGGEGSAGHKMSEKRKQEMKQIYAGEGNPMYGVTPKTATMRWYNLNDEEENMFVPGEQPDGWELGRKTVSEETRKKHSERQRQTGWKHKPESIEKMREKAKRRAPVTEETKAKMRASRASYFEKLVR